VADVLVDGPRLQEFTAQALTAAGLGVRHLPGYMRQMRAGGIVPGARVTTVLEGASTATLDGGAGLGHVAAAEATRVAIEKARAAGVAVVLVRNSNHCGALGHYALTCAEAGLIGMFLSNCPPVMTVTGSRTRVLGNGPTAYGAPNPGGAAIVFDAAMSVVAGGKVQMARERRQQVPPGWIVDADGRPTTDPETFVHGGALLPVGDHKGYGLALFGELLAGALSGAAMAAQIGSNLTPERPTGTGHAAIAISVDALMPAADFAARMADLREMITSAPRADGVEEILLPGELEEREERRTRRDGLELDEVIWRSLATMAGELGLAGLLERARR
jgi:LDH2 family malate/lactate/ureidoglycolate dehydrogenase